MPTTKEAALRVKSMGKQHIALALWCEDDVLERAKERGIKLTREQARQVIDMVDSKQDCSIGINWDVLDAFIDEVL